MAIVIAEVFERARRLRDNGKTTEALALYQDIATLSIEEKNDRQAAEALRAAGTSVLIGIGQGEESKFRQASELLSRSYTLFTSLNDRVKQGAVLRDIGSAADRFGRSAVALEAFQRSIEILSSTEELAELAATYDKLGLYFTYQKQPETALPYIDKALDLLRQEPTSGYFGAITLFDRGITQLALGNIDQARSDAESALSWFEADHGDFTFDVRRAKCHSLLGLICEQLQDPKSARTHLDQASRLLKKFDSEVAAAISAEVKLWTEL